MRSAAPLVALDGRRLQDDPPGGVGRAIRGLLPPLAARCDVTLLTDASRPAPAPVDGVEVIALARRRGLPEATWLHGAARRWRRAHPATVFHGTFNAVPFGAGRGSVVTIWDLSFELHSEDFATPRRRILQQWFRANARYSASRAEVVVTSSRSSAEQLAERYGVPNDRLVTIPIAVDPIFTPSAADALPELRARLGIHGRYLVAVGGAPRRGAEVAVGTWRALRAAGQDVELIVLGRVEHVPQPGLHVVDGLADAEWAALLAGAELLCYPTRYEGFGLPGLEAQASGTPVVAAPGSSLPEVLGDAAAWVSHPTVAAMLPAITTLLDDPVRAESLRRAGLEHAAAWPTWDAIADRHVELYRAIG